VTSLSTVSTVYCELERGRNVGVQSSVLCEHMQCSVPLRQLCGIRNQFCRTAA
jgi:hypothetical protein